MHLGLHSLKTFGQCYMIPLILNCNNDNTTLGVLLGDNIRKLCTWLDNWLAILWVRSYLLPREDVDRNGWSLPSTRSSTSTISRATKLSHSIDPRLRSTFRGINVSIDEMPWLLHEYWKKAKQLQRRRCDGACQELNGVRWLDGSFCRSTKQLHFRQSPSPCLTNRPRLQNILLLNLAVPGLSVNLEPWPRSAEICHFRSLGSDRHVHGRGHVVRLCFTCDGLGHRGIAT